MFGYFSPENRAVYEIVWKHKVQSDGPVMTEWDLTEKIRKQAGN
jgi:hypothetical protein